MAHLIDKDALVSEIERRLHFDNNWIEGDKRRQIHTNSVSSAYYKRIGSKHACESILDFIDTLEVKEMDLEKEIQNHIKECLDVKFPTTDVELIKKDVAYTAKKFFELGLKAQKGEL